MNHPTLKATEHKVYLALRLVSVVIFVGLTFSNLATEKSITDTKYKLLENNTAVKFNSAKSHCYAVTGFVFDKCIADAEPTRNGSRLALDTKRKVIIGTEHESKSNTNTAKLESRRNVNSGIVNTMPVIDELAPAFKKTRLI